MMPRNIVDKLKSIFKEIERHVDDFTKDEPYDLSSLNAEDLIFAYDALYDLIFNVPPFLFNILFDRPTCDLLDDALFRLRREIASREEVGLLCCDGKFRIKGHCFCNR